MKFNLDNKDNKKFTTIENISQEIISSNQLFSTIYGDGGSIKDDRFLPFEKGGVFKYFDLQKLDDARFENNRLYYSIIKERDLIVGLLELEKVPYTDDKHYWITFVSVDPKYQGKGYTSIVLDQAFQFAQKENITLESSSYVEQEDPKLQESLERINLELAKKYKVSFINGIKR